MSLTASDEYHDLAPTGVDRATLEADAAALLPLLDSSPGIHIYTPSAPIFPTVQKVLNQLTDDIKCLAIVRPNTEAEIRDTLRLCSSLNIKVTIRSGGNDVGERSIIHGGVVIDMRSMDFMTLSADRSSVSVGGGITHGKILTFLDKNELDTPVGWGHQVGYVAWACGGGYGVECGSRGIGSDQILGGRVVTANGDVLEVEDGKGDEDVWWALRGGGAGIVGVVSELTVKVYPKLRVMGGYVMFPFAEVEQVFDRMQKLYEKDFPDHFAGEVYLIDPMNNGGLVNQFFWWELGDDEATNAEAAEKYLVKVKEFGTVVSCTVAETTPYKFLYSIENPVLDVRQAFFNASAIVPSFSRELGAVFAKHPLPSITSAVVLHNCHGVGARRDPKAAFGPRQPHVLAGIVASCEWEDEASKTKIKGWPQLVYDDITENRLDMGWKYSNFNPPEPGDGRMYLGEDGACRMRSVRERLDPKGLFARCTPDLGSA
ncbi:uncharacterized protein BCR38DRAFT_411978 [Pseudomassariella vexata]|uniref:FAD-binding PCMH-type domain-containing protein n=1 Tax=Pseudomassariella vexata TaxID=1141098 RepID=A0A1Y2DNK0_9PEZI|nr:uncharacterized protein BCR38DRAFT_411978 [Pseudomassariella vexata]ORY60868.1 hypothetical protein BCR38DRAFT_411978 [Pseudomassariella vexata]